MVSDWLGDGRGAILGSWLILPPREKWLCGIDRGRRGGDFERCGSGIRLVLARCHFQDTEKQSGDYRTGTLAPSGGAIFVLWLILPPRRKWLCVIDRGRRGGDFERW